MILPLPMAIDATACLACRCGRAKQRLPKVSVHPVVAAPRAGTGARSCGETRPAVVAGLAPKYVARNAAPQTARAGGVISQGPALGLKRGRSVRRDASLAWSRPRRHIPRVTSATAVTTLPLPASSR